MNTPSLKRAAPEALESVRLVACPVRLVACNAPLPVHNVMIHLDDSRMAERQLSALFARPPQVFVL